MLAVAREKQLVRKEALRAQAHAQRCASKQRHKLEIFQAQALRRTELAAFQADEAVKQKRVAALVKRELELSAGK